MCTFGAKSALRSLCVVAAITALLFARACFWRLYATMRAVSRSSVLQNSSSIHHCAGEAVNRAMQ